MNAKYHAKNAVATVTAEIKDADVDADATKI